MGEQYRGIALRCLRIGNAVGETIGDGLFDFYWSVVLELFRLEERVKVLRPRYVMSNCPN